MKIYPVWSAGDSKECANGLSRRQRRKESTDLSKWIKCLSFHLFGSTIDRDFKLKADSFLTRNLMELSLLYAQVPNTWRVCPGKRIISLKSRYSYLILQTGHFLTLLSV